MRIHSVRFRENAAEADYLIEPCESEYPFKVDPSSGDFRVLSGAQIHEEFEVAGEAPV